MSAPRRPRPEDLAYAVPIAEAARLLGVSPRTVQRLVVAGHLRPFYLPHSGRPRLPLDQVLALRRMTTPPARAPVGKGRRAPRAR